MLPPLRSANYNSNNNCNNNSNTSINNNNQQTYLSNNNYNYQCLTSKFHLKAHKLQQLHTSNGKLRGNFISFILFYFKNIVFAEMR